MSLIDSAKSLCGSKKNNKTAKCGEGMVYKMINAIGLAFVLVTGLIGYVYAWLNSGGSPSNEMFAIGLLSAVMVLSFVATGWKLFAVGKSVSDIEILVRLDRLAEGKSPLSLTKRGKELSELIDGKKTAQKHKDKVKAPALAPPYAIQKACLAFARDKLIKEFSADEISFLETIAYQEGTDVKSLCLIVGLEMRDLILDERENKQKQANA